jgi:hypothetical protein
MAVIEEPEDGFTIFSSISMLIHDLKAKFHSLMLISSMKINLPFSQIAQFINQMNNFLFEITSSLKAWAGQTSGFQYLILHLSFRICLTH